MQMGTITTAGLAHTAKDTDGGPVCDSETTVEAASRALTTYADAATDAYVELMCDTISSNGRQTNMQWCAARPIATSGPSE